MAKYHVVGWVHRLAVINNRNDVICEAASYSMAKRIAAAMNRAEALKVERKQLYLDLEKTREERNETTMLESTNKLLLEKIKHLQDIIDILAVQSNAEG